MKIKLLPDSVANQIAAGEVVGNASSVVKEMTENAIDAGATLVTVNFRADGRELVQVTDNGEGMTPADARLAFDKHATSKITSIEDIYRLGTFGFRGEALASIAAVAQVELTTRTEEEELGVKIVMEGGQFISQEAVVAPKGSTFKVRNLFYNVPARRKFIEDSEREAAKIKTEFQRVALCHPEVAFMLYKDDAPLYNLPISTLKGRISALMGKAVAAQLLDVDTNTTIVSVSGFVGRPEAAKKRNKEQYLFVNGRFFKSPYIHKAVMMAYEKLLPQGVYPSYFLYLQVDTEKVDVNVHPQKTEVKFSEESEIWQIVNAAVRESLAKTGAVPMMDFEDEGEVTIPIAGSGRTNFQEPATVRNPFYNPFAVGEHPSVGSRSFASERMGDVFASYPSSPEGDIERELDSSIRAFIEGGESVVEHTQQELDLEKAHHAFKGSVPLAGGYAATSLGGRLAIVNLARAREVLLFRRYMMMLSSGNSVGQSLLFPERMVLSADDVELMQANEDRFLALGFEFGVVDMNTVEFGALPADVSLTQLGDVLYDLIDTLRDGQKLSDQKRKEQLAATLSRCSSSKQLTDGEVEAVLDSLDGCNDCATTYDGKPVMRLVELADVTSLF